MHYDNKGLQSSQVKCTPQDSTIEFSLQKLNPLVVVDSDSSLYSCNVCVISLEFTCKAVMKFLPVQCPCVDVDVDLWSNFIYSKIFNYLTKHREVLVKYSLHIMHAGMLIHEFDLTPVTGTTSRFIFYQKISSLKESCGVRLTCLDCKMRPKKTHCRLFCSKPPLHHFRNGAADWSILLYLQIID